MPLRLALMAAIGALLALGACSRDTNVVTTPAPMTDPDPAPTPTPTPTPAAVTLPAEAADGFPRGDTVFTIRSIAGGHPAADVDENGNRFVDRGGYRFICRGEDACAVTVTKDANGMLSVDASGALRRGEVPAVRMAVGIARFLRPSSGSRQQFTLAAGGMETQNGVTMTCPGASAGGCVVVIETRGTGMDAVTDAIGTGGVTFASVYPAFYDGLAYYGTDSARSTDDPVAISNDAGAAVGGFGSGALRYAAGMANTYAHLRLADAGADPSAEPAWIWANASAIGHILDVAPERVRESPANAFAGFSDTATAADRGRTYGASPVGVRLGLTITAGRNVATPLPLLYDPDPLAWEVELPADKAGAGANAAFAYGDADMRSAADRWSQGFAKTMRLGADTEDDVTDDGTLHVQAFTDYETDETAAAAAATIPTGAVRDRTVLAVSTGGAVPAAPPETQRFERGSTRGTLDGVPGTFACTHDAGCVVTTASGGGQTLAGGMLTFTPTANALMSDDDTDWLAIGTWAVAMDNGNTVFGAFHQGGEDWGANITAAVGDATYAGIARGRFAEHNDGVRSSGLFSGDVTLEAEFGNVTANGSIEGTVRNFSTTPYEGGTATDRAAWALDFAEVNFAAASGFGFDIPMVTGRWGSEADNTLTGRAHAKFYGRSEPNVGPTAIAGAFLATSEANDDHYDLSLFGAFGAVKQ